MSNLTVGLTEAEALDLSGYEIRSNPDFSGGGLIMVSSNSGTASGTFVGTTGNYVIDVDWINENDGASEFELWVGGSRISSWTGIGGNNNVETKSVSVAISNGDTVEIRGSKNAGEFARLDSLTITESSSGSGPAPAPQSSAAQIGLGLTEAEDLDLSGYEVRSNSDFSGGGLITVTNNKGTASGAFNGTSGNYVIDVDWINEDDGVSSFELWVGGSRVSSWTGTGGNNTVETRSVAVPLESGEMIEIRGTKGGGEFARLDSLTVRTNTGGGSTPDPEPQPQPSGAQIGIGLTEAEDLDLSGYEVRSNSDFSGGGLITVTNKNGTASGTFTGPADDYIIDVDWINEDDGVSSFELWVGGSRVSSWTGTGGANAVETRSVAVPIESGDTIEIRGTKGGGEFARLDSLTVRTDTGGGSTPDPEPQPQPSGAQIGLGLTEAEDLDLSGYEVRSNSDFSGGGLIMVSNNSGTASGTFAGTSGNYVIDVDWINENDGASQFELWVGGSRVSSWTGTGGNNSVETQSVSAAISNGDTIEIRGTKNAGEFARLDSLTVRTGSAPDPDPQPGPSGAEIGLGLTEAEDLDLSGYEVRSNSDFSGGGLITLTNNNGTASGNFTGPAGNYLIDVDWINENDGVSKFELWVGGSKKFDWDGTGGANNLETRTVSVAMRTGDEIEIRGTKGGGEFARVDSLTVREDNGTPTDPLTDAFDYFVFAGQSNAEGHFFVRSGDNTGSQLGHEWFEDTIRDLTGVRTNTIEAALGGSGSNNLADGQKFWWNLNTDSPGNALTQAIDTIRAAVPSGRDVDGIIWAQGEDDLWPIENRGADPDVVADRLKYSTTKVFETLRAEFGDVPIFIQELGEFDPLDDIAVLRAAQDELIAELGYVYDGASTAGLAHHDSIHFTNAAYGQIAQDLAQSAFDVIGDEFLFA